MITTKEMINIYDKHGNHVLTESDVTALAECINLAVSKSSESLYLILNKLVSGYDQSIKVLLSEINALKLTKTNQVTRTSGGACYCGSVTYEEGSCVVCGRRA